MFIIGTIYHASNNHPTGSKVHIFNNRDDADGFIKKCETDPNFAGFIGFWNYEKIEDHRQGS